MGRRTHLPPVQGQCDLAQRLLENIQPTMIDPKQGPLFHTGRGAHHIANLRARIASSKAAQNPEPIRHAPTLTVVK